MKRSPLRRTKALSRGTSTLRRSRLSPRSAKRLSEIGQRADMRQRVLERDKVCRLNPTSLYYPHGAASYDPGPCLGILHAHEPLTRARGGNYLDPDAAVALCTAHHDWVHTHPVAGVRLGLLRSSWD